MDIGDNMSGGGEPAKIPDQKTPQPLASNATVGSSLPPTPMPQAAPMAPPNSPSLAGALAGAPPGPAPVPPMGFNPQAAMALLKKGV